MNKSVSPKYIVAICLFLIAVASTLFLTLRPSDSKQPIVNSSSSTANLVSSGLKNHLLANYPGLALQKTYDPSLTTGYQFPGENFQVLLPVSSASYSFKSYTTNTESAYYGFLIKTQPMITKYLEQQGFSAPSDQTPAGALLTQVSFYKSSDYLCQLTIYTQLDFNCTELPQLENKARSLVPFVSLFLNVNLKPTIYSVGTVKYSKSQTPGYRLASINFYDSGAETLVNFYEPPHGNWQVVSPTWYANARSNEIVPECTAFDSQSSVAAAFKGYRCFNIKLWEFSSVK